MSTGGKRSRVRLHSGGISPGQVRLRKGGASEKGTAPGRDIRDIGPDRGPGKGPRACRSCGKPVVKDRGVRCERCLADDRLVKEVRRKLAELGLPPLGKTVAKSSPLWRKRTQAEAALRRLGKSSDSARPRPPVPAETRTSASRAPATKTSSRTCPRCFMALPSTGQCDDCA